MAKAKPTKTQPEPGPNHSLAIAKQDGESESLAIARSLMAPAFRHAMPNAQLLKSQIGTTPNAPDLGDYADAIRERGSKAAKGDLDFASRMLAAQATTLDNIFTEMARRMALNMGEYLGATETYSRIALKAQAGSRATLEALAKLHQPREQTVRHVHVNEGGQAVIADQFHHHANQGGQDFEKSDEQPHAPEVIGGTTGETAGQGPALPSPDTFGAGVPIPSGEGCEKVPNARRQR